MPIGSEVGLSFSDSVAAAQAELDGSPEDASTLDNVLEQELVVEAEYPTDDPKDNEGLFVSLFSDEDDEFRSTPQYAEDSALVVVNGKDMTVSEVKKGFLRHEDYTQKTQELALQRQAAQNAVTLWEALENDPLTTLRTLNARLSAGQMPAANDLPFQRGARGQSASTVDVAAGNVDDVVEKKVAERLANDPRIKAYEDQQARTALDSVFKKIEAEWNVSLTDGDKLAVLEKAKASGTSDLELVFAGLMSLVSRKKAQRQVVKQGATLNGRGFADGDEVVVKEEIPSDFKDAMRQAMRELRVQDLTNLK